MSQSSAASPAPKKRRLNFSAIIRGVFPSARPRIIGSPAPGPAAAVSATGQPAYAPPGAAPAGAAATGSPQIAQPPGQQPARGRWWQTWLQSLGRQLTRSLPLWVMLAIMAVFALAVTLVVMLYLRPLSQKAMQTLDRQPAGETASGPDLLEPVLAATPTPKEYPDDLHGFKVTYNETDGWLTGPAAPACAGSIFALDAQGLKTPDPRHPRMQICFLAFQLDDPGKSLNDYLSERLVAPLDMQVLEADRGLIKDAVVGTGKTSALGAFLLGVHGATSQPAKWYVTTMNFEGRIYALEAVATQEDWNRDWPKMARLIEQVTFETGVIRPANTPIVIQ